MGSDSMTTAPEDTAALTVLLAVTQIDRFSKVMSMNLSGQGRKVHLADDLESFRKATEDHNPDVVVMDGAVDYAPELRQWLKGRPGKKLTSLIVFYPEEMDPESFGGFYVLEDEHIREPYEIASLNALIQSEAERLESERKYFLHEVKFRLPSEPAYVQQGGDFLEQLTQDSGLDEEAWLSLVNACREALDNAARHGNHSSPDLRLHVTYVLDTKKATVTVRDEGEGFNVGQHLGDGVEGDAVALARKRHSQGKVGGLGIMLMLRCVDKVEYNRTGNELKLTKFIENRAAVAS